MTKPSGALFAAVLALATLPAADVAAHHTYSHQRAGDLRLFSTKDLQILLVTRDDGKRLCGYLIPRRKGTLQWGAQFTSVKSCPASIWLDIRRGGDGAYTLSPAKDADRPAFLTASVTLEPVRGGDYRASRTRFSISGLTPAMTRADIEAALADLPGLSPRDARIEIKGGRAIDTTGFIAEAADRNDGFAGERVTIVLHRDGADGHFNSEPNSVVAINREQRMEAFKGPDLEPFLADLRARLGEPSHTRVETWPDTDKTASIDMVWAVGDDGTIARDVDPIRNCGASRLGVLRVSEVVAEKTRGRIGTIRFSMPYHDMFDGKPIVEPGGCVLVFEARVGVSLQGKVHRFGETLVDTGLLTDIYNKGVFDMGKAMAAKLTPPSEP